MENKQRSDASNYCRHAITDYAAFTSFNPIQVFLLSFAESLDNRYKLILALSLSLMI
jgi:hypothetical protein